MVTGLEVGEGEVVADASERLDGFGWDLVELGGRVTEAGGESVAHLEVERALRLVCDRLVHRLDLVAQALDVDARHRLPPRCQ